MELEIRRRRALRDRVAAHERLVDLDLLDFIPALSPKLERPDHLAPLAQFFDRVNRGEVVRMLFSAPPQMGKSVVMTHGTAQYLARSPDRPIIYAGYGSSIAEQKSRDARDLAQLCGVELRPDASAIGDWLTPEGGGLRARGIGGPTTGNPAKLFIIDDPHKDRVDAESALMLQRVFDWYVSVAETRTHPDSSILVAHARWHDDDLIGRLSRMRDKRGKPLFEHVNLPAIGEDGSPLWYARPLSWLEPKKQLEHEWLSLWMGTPRPRGQRLFKGIRFYDRLPARFRIGKGVDLASTEKTSACHSVGLTMVEHAGYCYVVDVRRAQVEVPDFVPELRAASVLWPGVWHWFSSTTERGTAQLITEMGEPIEAVLATQDKYVRAQPVAAKWNEGRVLVPRTMAALLGDRASREDHEREVPWVKDFVDEVNRFTGKGATDQVDALGSAYESVRYDNSPGVVPMPDPNGRWEDDARGFG